VAELAWGDRGSTSGYLVFAILGAGMLLVVVVNTTADLASLRNFGVTGCAC
jgi:hypothetical protein